MATISAALAIALEHHRAGRLALAEEIYRRVLAVEPEQADALQLLGAIAHQTGRYQEALAYLARAIAVQPTVAVYHNNRGEAYRALHDEAAAVACYRQALQLDPGCVEALNNLGACLLRQGELEEAIACLQQAVQRGPDYAEAHSNLGIALRKAGHLAAAIACYRRAVQLKPELTEPQSTLLSLLHYDEGATPEGLAAAHAAYGQQLAALRSTWPLHDNRCDPERPLRLGFVSPDLGQHPVGYFLLPVLENLGARQCAVHCYSDREAADTVTRRLQAAAAVWRDTAALSHVALAQQILADQIDVLFDLAGHTSRNRLPMFARHPAPVQITWLGYVGTTGLDAMDYLLADRHHVPAEAEEYYVERVLRLPDSYACFAPPAEAPLPGPLPASGSGRLTFASFNNPDKITRSAVAAWAEILRRLPRARLVLRYIDLDRPGRRAPLHQAFADHGVAAERVECFGASPHDELLAAYRQVDVALDTYLYSGGLTTCEALWMGVPVVTCPGATFASRHALSYLSTVGLTETVAADHAQYVDLAVALGNDLPRLATLRSTLRERMATSPLCNGPRFAQSLMALLREAWRRWCEERARHKCRG
jgi:predicted O-linked N-acetylglucosamine transferase (SPINDLY family)